MSVPIRLQITNQSSGETTEVSGRIAEPDWRVLELFVECCRQLDRCAYVQAKMPLKLNISWTREDGFKSPPPLPPENHIREFLHVLRPFVLESENTYLPKVCGILARAINEPLFQKNLKQVQRSFNGKHSQAYFTLSSDDVILNSESTLRMWLNAFEYHRDQEKREKLESLHRSMPIDISKGLFIDLLRYKVEAIWWISAFLEGLQKSPTVIAHLAARPLA